MQKTTITTKEQFKQNRQWYEVDATDVVLGKLAVFCADILRGKNKPNFANNTDCGDYIIVRNAQKVKLTGKKLTDKKYYTHSQYIGGLRTRTAKEMIAKYPTELVYEAIKGMVPKTKLGKAILLKLFIYADAGKTHEAQKPTKVEVTK